MSEQEPVASTSSSIHAKPHDPSLDEQRPSTRDTTTEDAAAESDDELLEELELDLENDFDLGGFRERRMEELKAQLDRMKQMKESNHGKYSTFINEKDIISTTAKAKRSLVHFFLPDFRRCKIMDGHLEKLAAKHHDTLFLRVNVADAPFLVTKLEVKVLPCVVGFVDGLSKLKIVGFEELPGGDNFSTASLENGLIESGVITLNPSGDMSLRGLTAAQRGSSTRRGIRSGGGHEEDSE